MDSAEKTRDNDTVAIVSRGPILWVLLAAIVVLAVPLVIAHFFFYWDWYRPCVLVFYGIMAITPLLLARIAPKAATFDTQWFPHAWLHWLWFLGMVLLVFVCRGLALRLAYFPEAAPYGMPEIPTAATVIFAAVTAVLIGPIAEEIFWRGYLLEQLRKLTPSAIALLIQSLLFGLAHAHRSNTWFAVSQGFLIGLVLGMWRIRFRSLVPLMLAHMIFNGVVALPVLMERYRAAKPFVEIDQRGGGPYAEYVKNVRSNPKCRQIAVLTREPPEKAVPAIIGFLADDDQTVRAFAGLTLVERYRREAEPYLKEALSSRDKNTRVEALLAVCLGHYARLKQKVRDIAWSDDDPKVQSVAVNALGEIEDEEGLRDIAQRHPTERVRQSAERWLEDLRPKPADSSPPPEEPKPSAQSTENPE